VGIRRERMLDEIGLSSGWRCADPGSGPLGIVKPLSRRAGIQGHVTATDVDPGQLAALQEYASPEGLGNMSAVQDDVYHSKLPAASFDLVHVRYVFSPIGRNSELMTSLISLCR